MTPRVADLAAQSDEDLIALHDRDMGSYGLSGTFYLEELARRAQARQGDRMERMTHTIERMTGAVVVLTIVNVAVAVVSSILSAEVLLR